ncbi:MAG: hypothetical protein AAF433_15340 [Bacteroidota bacterium]
MALLLGLLLPLRAQFGISAVYTVPQVSFADGSIENFLDDGLEFSANYWFRLKEKRVEFLPTISYVKYNYSDREVIGQEPLFPATFREIGFQFHTRIYPFDFGTDCDCPTFGKQAPALEKGFFIQLSPGISWLEDVNSIRPPDQEDEQQASSFLPTIGVAVGLDFGLSNLVTLSPIAGFRYSIGDAPNALEYNSAVATDDNYSKFFAGLHLGIRLDEKRY